MKNEVSFFKEPIFVFRVLFDCIKHKIGDIVFLFDDMKNEKW